MARIKREIEIHNTPEQVWTDITDFKKWPTWFYGVRNISVQAEGLGLGAERVVTLITGRSYRERFIHWDTNDSFTFFVKDPPVFIEEWRDSIRLKPINSGVILSWEIDYSMRYGILGKMADAILITPIIDKVLLFSLKRFKNIMEA
jgi:hypothetical protein